LGGEGDADSCARAEEVAESAGRDAELCVAGDGSGLGAGGIEAEGGGVGEAVDGSGESGDVAEVIVARVLAVEQIEEFGEWAELRAFSKSDIAADAEIHLVKRRASELVERGLRTVDYGAVVAGEAVVVDVGGSGDAEGTSAFELRERGDFEAPGELQSTDQDEAVANVFAGWTVIAGTESVERVRNAVDVVKKFADYGAPSSGMRENVVGGQFEAIGKAMLELKC